MGWKDFFASVINSLAWPAAFAFVVYLLREPLRRLLRGLRKVDYRGATFEFGEAVQEVEVAAKRADLPAPEPDAGEPALSTELASVIVRAPRSAVIEAWLAVERELDMLARRAGVHRRADRRWTPWSETGELQRLGVIDDSLASVLDELTRARDVAGVEARADGPTAPRRRMLGSSSRSGFESRPVCCVRPRSHHTA
jgi:hypothetical protein